MRGDENDRNDGDHRRFGDFVAHDFVHTLLNYNDCLLYDLANIHHRVPRLPSHCRQICVPSWNNSCLLSKYRARGSRLISCRDLAKHCLSEKAQGVVGALSGSAQELCRLQIEMARPVRRSRTQTMRIVRAVELLIQLFQALALDVDEMTDVRIGGSLNVSSLASIQ